MTKINSPIAKSYSRSNLKNLSDADLFAQTQLAARSEKNATLVLLEHLAEVESRRLFAKRAFSSLFEYVVKELHYSESQAAERIGAMRLMKDITEVKVQIKTGELSITTASQIQRFFKAERKIVKKEFSKEEKMHLIAQCKSQPKRGVEKILLQHSVAPAPLTKEKERMITAEATELKFSISEKARLKLERIRNQLGSHVTLAELFEKGLDQLLHLQEKKHTLKRRAQRSEPCAQAESACSKHAKQNARAPINQNLLNGSKGALAQNSTLPAKSKIEDSTENSGLSESSAPINSSALIKSSALTEGGHACEAKLARNPSAPSSRYVSKAVREATAERSQNRCEYVDPLTCRRCAGKYRLQYDHVVPFAMGGKADAQNIRHLCAAHNQLAAIRAFGSEKIASFIPTLHQ